MRSRKIFFDIFTVLRGTIGTGGEMLSRISLQTEEGSFRKGNLAFSPLGPACRKRQGLSGGCHEPDACGCPNTMRSKLLFIK